MSINIECLYVTLRDLPNSHNQILYGLEVPNVVMVKLNSLNIVEAIWSDQLEEIEKIHLEQLIALIKEIGKGEKMLVYMDTYSFTPISNEARKYAATDHASRYTKANAVLVDSLAKKLLFNFYLKFEAPVSPTKGFTTRDGAFDWLKQL